MSASGSAGFVPVSPGLVPATLFARRKYWAARFGIAPVLPMTRAEMDELGWDSCDVILVTGDAYVDHPSFGMALVGRLLEAQGFRVGILSQPDWRSADAFRALGRPTVMWGVTGGNMDSMVNRYTADRRLRHDDAYSPAGQGGLRPDRATVVYSHRCREAFRDVPIVLGGIEASLRRIAHYDYWSDKVRWSILADAKADLLVYGNGERAVVEIAHRLAAGEAPEAITDLRGTAFLRPAGPREGWTEIDVARRRYPGAGRSAARSVRCRRGGLRARGRRAGRPVAAGGQPSPAPPAGPHRGPDAARRGRVRRPGAVRARLAAPPPRGQSGQRPGARPAPR
jgi:hypothetical protein